MIMDIFMIVILLFEIILGGVLVKLWINSNKI